MSRAFKRRMSGVTLFEVLLVLFVAAFIAAAVATIYAKVNTTFKQNQLQADVQQLTANVTAAYNGQYPSGEGGMTPEILHNAGLVPSGMWSSTGTPITPFVPDDSGWSVAGDTSTFTLTVAKIPTASCTGMFQAFMTISTGSPLKVGEAEVTDAPSGIAACSEGGSAAFHDIHITVR